MKRLISIFVLLFLITGCFKKNIEYDWELKESEYLHENLTVEDNFSNAVVSIRKQNHVSNDKEMMIKIYCQHYDIGGIIIDLKFSDTEDELKESLLKDFNNILSFDNDEYLENTINNLYLNFENKEKIIEELTYIYQNDIDKKLIITIGNDEIIYEEWNDLNYSLENGTKDNVSYESRAYLGKNNAYK